jgi:barstar (barnase inhibitor)
MNRGLYRVPRKSLDSVEAEFAAGGGMVFRLPNGIATRDDFFDAVRKTLPLDPPLLSNRSWDALSDSLWEGLHVTPFRRVLIRWDDSRTLAEGSPADHAISMDVLQGITESLADPLPTVGAPKDILVLLGEQEND